MIFVFASQRWPDSAPHQPQPERQSREQEYLPEPAEIHIFVALRSQNQRLPSFCSMPIHSPASEPTTTATSATKSTFTPSLCPFGSAPLTAGTIYKPVA